MDSDVFWDLIGTIDGAALAAGDEERALANLREALAEASVDDITGFADLLAEALYALDGREHADASGENAGSDDGFLYARCFVVAQGKARYQAVLRDPAQMPTSSDEWCESLVYVAPNAWAERTGEDPSSYDHVSPRSYETGANRARWR